MSATYVGSRIARRAFSPQTRRPSARWFAEQRRGRRPAMPSHQLHRRSAASAHRVGARGRWRGRNTWPCRRRVPAGCRPPGPLRRRAVVGTPTVHPAADSAGTPQRGPRPRHTGRPVRPADARRDSGVQQSRGASPTGYLTGAEAELLRTAAAPPPAVPETPPPPQAVPAATPTTSSAAASTSAETDSSPAPPANVAAEQVDPQNAGETNTQQRPRAPGCRRNRPTAA